MNHADWLRLCLEPRIPAVWCAWHAKESRLWLVHTSKTWKPMGRQSRDMTWVSHKTLKCVYKFPHSDGMRVLESADAIGLRIFWGGEIPLPEEKNHLIPS